MWEKVKLGELVSQHGGLIQTGPFGSQLHEADYSEEGIPVVMPKDIIDGKISEESAAKISDDIYRRLKRHALKIGDIVLPRRGNLDKRAVITEREKGWLCGTGCLKINVNPEVLDSTFFFYYLSLPEIVEYLENMAVGSTMLNLSAGILEKFEFPLPPISLQRQIAAVLGRYDALLENYQGQVAALEGLAQELYREWFVRGRCPGAVVGSAGELPAGWEIRRLGDVIELKYGKALIAEDRIPGEFPVVGSSGIVDFHDESLINRPGIVVGRKGNVGSVIWLDKPFYPIDTVFYVESDLSSYYLFYNLQQQNFISGDSAVPGLNREQALGNKIIIPDSNSLADFDRIVGPIFEKRLNLNNQIDLLRASRDALLPRLISGQLVPAAA